MTGWRTVIGKSTPPTVHCRKGLSVFRGSLYNTDYLILPSDKSVHTLFINANKSANIHNFDYIMFQDNALSVLQEVLFEEGITNVGDR